jgi:hypothetical protein
MRSPSASALNHCPLSPSVRQEEQHIRASQLLQVFSTACRAQDEKGIVERIASRSAIREHRDTQDSLDGPSCAWIHDV